MLLSTVKKYLKNVYNKMDNLAGKHKKCSEEL